MKQILIVEDDININNMILENFTKNDLKCTQAFSGTEALLCIQIQNYDLILLDLMLPGMMGEDVLAKIKEKSNSPVIIVSAKDSLDTKIDLLSLGAEDYITKPFEIKELLARAFVQLRRNDKLLENNLIYYKELKLDKLAYKVTINEKEINLTKQEFKIMELLLLHRNRVFSKQEMYEYAWESYYLGEDKTINVHISNIRSKLKNYSNESYIETVWGIGFKLA